MPGQDLTVSMNLHPLNPINVEEKFSVKVLTDRIQDFGGEMFHHLQYRSVKGRLAVHVSSWPLQMAQECTFFFWFFFNPDSHRACTMASLLSYVRQPKRLKSAQGELYI